MSPPLFFIISFLIANRNHFAIFLLFTCSGKDVNDKGHKNKPEHVGVTRRKTKALPGGWRQHGRWSAWKIWGVLA